MTLDFYNICVVVPTFDGLTVPVSVGDVFEYLDVFVGRLDGGLVLGSRVPPNALGQLSIHVT